MIIDRRSKIMFSLSLLDLDFWMLVLFKRSGSCVFLIFATRVDQNKWINSSEIDPFRKSHVELEFVFFNLYDKSPETLSASRRQVRFHMKLTWKSWFQVIQLFIFKVTEPNSIPYRTHPVRQKGGSQVNLTCRRDAEHFGNSGDWGLSVGGGWPKVNFWKFDIPLGLTLVHKLTESKFSIRNSSSVRRECVSLFLCNRHRFNRIPWNWTLICPFSPYPSPLCPEADGQLENPGKEIEGRSSRTRISLNLVLVCHMGKLNPWFFIHFAEEECSCLGFARLFLLNNRICRGHNYIRQYTINGRTVSSVPLSFVPICARNLRLLKRCLSQKPLLQLFKFPSWLWCPGRGVTATTLGVKATTSTLGVTPTTLWMSVLLCPLKLSCFRFFIGTTRWVTIEVFIYLFKMLEVCQCLCTLIHITFFATGSFFLSRFGRPRPLDFSKRSLAAWRLNHLWYRLSVSSDSAAFSGSSDSV